MFSSTPAPFTGAKNSPQALASAITRDLLNKDLVKAAEHYNGKGIDKGIDFSATLSVLRSLKGNHYAFKCALETVISAATWPNARVAEAYPQVSPKCVRCGAENDDALHCFWQCPANNNIEEESVSSTQSLCGAAQAQVLTHPCLWLRGILPRDLTNIPEEYLPTHDHKCTYTYINEGVLVDTTDAQQANIRWESGTYYGDASGGELTAYSELRRVGVAVCKIYDTGKLQFGVRSNLPGDIQTVARGELFALTDLIDRAEQFSEIEYITDNWAVFNLYNKGPKHTALSFNSDLFSHLFYTLYHKSIALQVRWMPSHLKQHPTKGVLSCVNQEDIEGNHQADQLAGKAAIISSLPLNISANVLYYHSLTKRIQHRLATIIMSLPNRTKHDKPEKYLPDPPIPYTDIDTDHILFDSDNRVGCARCHDNFSKNDSSLKVWLSTKCKCNNIHHSSNRPTPLPLEVVHSGNRHTHHTHSLYKFRGLIFCNKCGSRSGRFGLKHLGAPCEPPNVYGLASLKALRNGLLPPNLTQWPDEGMDSADPVPRGGTKRVCDFAAPKFIRFRRPRPIVVGKDPYHSLSPGTTPYTPTSPLPSIEVIRDIEYDHILRDLLELYDAGEKVIWPGAHNALSAKRFVEDYNDARVIASLYAASIPQTNLVPEDYEPVAEPEGLSGAQHPIPATEIVYMSKSSTVTVTPRMRRFVSISDYNINKLNNTTQETTSSSHEVTAHCPSPVSPPVHPMDDPDAPFMDDDDQ